MQPEAFRGIYDELKPKLLRYCTYRCGDPDTAEDIVQEAMLRLWRRDGEPPADAGNWLFTTARHLILDSDKIARNRRRLLASNPVQGSEPELADHALEREEKRTRVRRTLERMPERSREILMLRYSGFSYREIAGEVGVAPGSVGTLLARAERAFLAHMSPSEEDAGR